MSDTRRTLLLLRRDNEVLLAMKKRGFGAGYWNGVGGKLDDGETVEQAMIRESQEEIGVTPTKYYKIAELDFIGSSASDDPFMQGHAYIATEWDGEPVETEEMAPKWFKLDSLPFESMWQDDPHWMPLVFEGKSLKCTFSFDENDNLTDHEVLEVDPYD